MKLSELAVLVILLVSTLTGTALPVLASSPSASVASPTSTVDSASILTASREAIAKLKTFYFEEMLNVRSKLNKQTDVNMTTTSIGGIAKPDKERVEIERKTEQEGKTTRSSMTWTRVGTSTVLDFHGWSHGPDIIWETIVFFSPVSLIDKLLSSEAITLMSENQDFKGTMCYAFTGNVSSKVMGVDPDNIPTQAEILISKADLLVRQITLMGSIPEANGGGHFSVIIAFSNFDQEVNIELSPTAAPTVNSSPTP